MNQLIGTIRFPNLNIVLEHVGKEITILGLPMSFQRVLFTLVNILLARIICSFD